MNFLPDLVLAKCLDLNRLLQSCHASASAVSRAHKFNGQTWCYLSQNPASTASLTMIRFLSTQLQAIKVHMKKWVTS